MNTRGLLLSVLIVFIFSGETLFSQANQTEKKLKVGLRNSPPFVMTGDGAITGLSVNLWETTAGELDQAYEYVEFADLGMMLDAIERGDIDMCINPLTVTSERLRRFHFSQPFFISGLAFAVQAKESSPLILFVKRFFSIQFLNVLALLFLIIFTFGLLLWIVEHRKNPDQFSKGWKGLGDGIWWSAVTMTTVGYGDKAPKTGLGRVISIVWMFIAVIIISSFTGSISAALTYDRLQFSVNNFDDLRNVQTGTVRNSSTADLLRSARISYRGYETLEEAVDALSSGELNAVVYDEPLLAFLLTKPGYENISLISSAVRSVYFGFSSADNQLLEMINPYMIEKIESREWQRMLESYNLRYQ
jgi:polar amino acid transport system substrate-binding protein